MPKKKPTESSGTTDQQATGHLIEVLQSLTQKVEALTQQVGTLTDHAHVLTEAIDDVRMELEHVTRNLGRPAWVPTSASAGAPQTPKAETFSESNTCLKP